MKSDLLQVEPLEAIEYAPDPTPSAPLPPPHEPPPATWLRVLVSFVLIVVILGIGVGARGTARGDTPPGHEDADGHSADAG